MPKPQVSEEAWDDIDRIADYIAQHNATASVRWFDRVQKAMQSIADTPGIGSARDRLRPGLRSYALDNYLIFFRASGEGVEIVRVVDGRRNLRRLFQQ